MAGLQKLVFPGTMLQRGFWLYTWEIETVTGDKWLYVGRTGDSSSANAQSPFTRLGQHLGTNKHANALRRHLMNIGVDLDTCRSFEMVAFGPIFPEAATMDEHRPLRDKMAALEKTLCDALVKAGYPVLNKVHCLHVLDDAIWQDTFNGFAERFPKLRKI